MLKEILIGVAIGIIPMVGVVMVQTAARAQKLPKRIARVEAGMVMLLRGNLFVFDALLIIIRCQQGSAANGELDDLREAMGRSKAEMTEYLSGAAISQKATP
jgi:hypothetical protein